MDFYTPGTSYYPCPIRATDLFKSEPTPPLTWLSAGTASTVGRGQPDEEYEEKKRLSGGKSDSGYTSKEGQSASPAEQSTPVAKADIAQGPPSDLKYNKPIAESNVEPGARKPLAAANTTANARRRPKAASSRHRIQVILSHTKGGKENHSSNSNSEINNPFQPAKKNPSTGQEQVQVQVQVQEKALYNIENLPDPFVLTSEDECDDPFEKAKVRQEQPRYSAPVLRNRASVRRTLLPRVSRCHLKIPFLRSPSTTILIPMTFGVSVGSRCVLPSTPRNELPD